MDPFLDLIRMLRPRATLWARIDGVGRWGVSFRKRDDLLFCWVQRGECQLTRPLLAPVHLEPDDFVLVRTSTPFTLTSDPSVEPEDSETAVALTKDTGLKLGEGTDSPVTLRGGRFVFDTANDDLLTGLLPSMVHVAAGETSSWRVRSLLKMNETESLQPGPGSEFIIARLMELILVEILRSEALRVNQDQSKEHTGLLAGLADPVTALSLSAIHRDVAHGWTVSGLARLCGVSRSTFAARFRKIVGTGPIEYLLHWRMALAKDELRRGTRSIGEIALAIGFQSSSAFSTAFTRAVGCSPKRFAVSARC
jgi:AraC-like DNA-binding protein